ncbi:MAG: (d)CMP kinase [Microgenomates group bacterium]
MALQIAIDGPVAAGKGDIAARLAKRLHLLYIYTGAMYRMLALACIEESASMREEQAVFSMLNKSHIELVRPEKGRKETFIAMLNGKDVTDRIMEPDVAAGASDVGVFPSVRKEMVQRQQKLADDHPVVMEGRDIGLRVLPNAPLKVFLTASLEERAQRRFDQWKQKGIDVPMEEVIEETKIRDAQDIERVTDPLQKLPDSWELDSTTLSQEEVVDAIIQELTKRKLI